MNYFKIDSSKSFVEAGRFARAIPRPVSPFMYVLISDMDLTYQIWAQSHWWFDCKCVDTAWPIRDQETARIKQSMTKS